MPFTKQQKARLEIDMNDKLERLMFNNGLDPYGRDPYGRVNDGVDWVNPERERRHKYEYPYSYSEYYIWRNGNPSNADDAVYSDRLYEWDYEKHVTAWKVVGKRFDQMSRAELSKYLSAYFDKPIQAMAMAEGCNVSNGYPYWIFWYNFVEEKDDV